MPLPFEHVVVLMLENRSFDNILGYLYQDGVPAGKTFEGVAGKSLSNPDFSGQPVPASVGADFHQPYPDPGEEFDDVTKQLFGSNTANPTPPPMNGFVRNYYDTLDALKKWPGSPADQSRVIMQCFAPTSLPVLSALATQFAVFDHWYCAVPSQTWCNRAFWHAATSWGWVNNPPTSQPLNPWSLERWAISSAGATLFDLIENQFGAGAWHIYEDLPIPFTKLIHWGSLKDKIGEDYFRYLDSTRFFKNFFDDCAAGDLPKYSFIEPHFINFFEKAPWHDDWHPSSFGSEVYSDGGPGSVLLGDQLIWNVYRAIRNSRSANGNNWQNTLLIITCDEHGGCYDHVPPPSGATPPDSHNFNTGQGEEGFDFTRLGVRVPMVMVSAYIAKNTVVNTPMDHCSFLTTMAQKWDLPSLGPRQDSAPPFTEVFNLLSPRDLNTWPDFEAYPGPTPTLDPNLMRMLDPGTIPLNGLQSSIFEAMRELCASDPAAASVRLTTAKDAMALLDRVKSLKVPLR